MIKSHHTLLIDDDDIFIYLTKKMLHITGLVHQISICHSGTEAIDFLTININHPPDLIFLDLNMPGMDGWEFLEYYQPILKQLELKPQLFVISSSSASHEVEKALKINGVTGFATKPLDQAAILQMLGTTSAHKAG